MVVWLGSFLFHRWQLCHHIARQHYHHPYYHSNTQKNTHKRSTNLKLWWRAFFNIPHLFPYSQICIYLFFGANRLCPYVRLKLFIQEKKRKVVSDRVKNKNDELYIPVTDDLWQFSMVGFDGLDMNIPSLFQRRRIRVPTKLKFSNSTRSLYFRDRYEFHSLLTYIRVDICTYILLFRWLSLWMCPYRKLLPKEYFIIIYENIFFSKICFVY